MREIFFKAKRISDGQWVIGDLSHHKTGKKFIKSGSATHSFEVVPETICQYTGLTDKNGQKIWENDIVEFEDVGEEGYEYKEGFDFINRAMVEFAEARWSLIAFAEENSSVVDEMYNHAEFMDFWKYCEVIGNIHDNPELLGGSE